MLFLFFSVSFAQNYPQSIGYVNDYADIIGEGYEVELNTLISAFEKNTTVEIAVLTVNSLDGLDIETYAVEIYKEWGIGQKNENNGVLILVALNDQKMRIEVGYGLEGVLTDIHTKDIIDNIIKPKFKEEKYGEGIYNAVLAIKQIIETGGYEPSLVAKQDDGLDIFDIIGGLFIVIFSLPFLLFLLPFVLPLVLFAILEIYVGNLFISATIAFLPFIFFMKFTNIGRSISKWQGGLFNTSGGWSDTSGSWSGGYSGGSWSSSGSSWGGFGGGMSGGGGASGSW